MSGPRVFIHDMTCVRCSEVFSVLGSINNLPQLHCLCGNCLDWLNDVMRDSGLPVSVHSKRTVSDPRD